MPEYTATDLGKAGITVGGEWSEQTAYHELEIVSHNGGSYMSVKAVPAGTPLIDAAYWMPIAATAETIREWLDEHPEATTTVEDGVVSMSKLSPALQAMLTGHDARIAEIGDSVDEMSGSVDSIQTVVTQHTTDIAVLDARVDEIAQLPPGSTSGDAELADIRVGYDGTAYDTAGDAVREQVSDLHTALGGKADKGGDYSANGLVASGAHSLVNPDEPAVRRNFSLAHINGDGDKDSKAASIRALYGSTAIYNQLVRNGDFSAGTAGWTGNTSITSVSAADGTLTITCGTTLPSQWYHFRTKGQNVTIKADHKYLITVDVNPDISKRIRVTLGITPVLVEVVSPTIGEWNHVFKIYTSTEDKTNDLWVLQTLTGSGEYIAEQTKMKVKNVMIVDLTDWFGAGNEPETEAEFRRRVYATYLASSDRMLLPFRAAGIASTGANLLKADGTAYVVGGTQYRIVGEYASIKMDSGVVLTITDGVFTPPYSGILHVVGTGCAVFLASSGITEYMEHEDYTIALPIETYFPHGMFAIGDVHDELRPESAIQRIGWRAYVDGDEDDPTVVTDGTNTIYVLDSPVITSISSPINLSYPVRKWGTERIMYPASGISAMLDADIAYQQDFVGIIKELDENAVRKSSGIEAGNLVDLDENGKVHDTGIASSDVEALIASSVSARYSMAELGVFGIVGYTTYTGSETLTTSKSRVTFGPIPVRKGGIIQAENTESFTVDGLMVWEYDCNGTYIKTLGSVSTVGDRVVDADGFVKIVSVFATSDMTGHENDAAQQVYVNGIRELPEAINYPVTFETGTIASGEPSASANRMRSTDFLRVGAGTKIYTIGHSDIDYAVVDYSGIVYKVFGNSRDANPPANANPFVTIIAHDCYIKLVARSHWYNSRPIDYLGDALNRILRIEIKPTLTDDWQLPPYYYSEENADFLPSIVRRISAHDDDCGGSGDALMFMTDEHWGTNNGRSPLLAHYLTQHTNIRKIVSGGDMITSYTDSKETGKKEILRFRNCFPEYRGYDWMPIIGNHDTNNPSETSKTYELTASEAYRLIVKENENIITKIDNYSYFVDNTNQKLRSYFLGCFHTAQFLPNTLFAVCESFRTIPDGYSVVVYSHTGMNPTGDGYHVYTAGHVQYVFNALAAVAHKEAYSFTWAGVQHSYDYTGVNATVIGWISGHSHYDHIIQDNGVAMISVATDGAASNSSKQPYPRVANTVEEQSFDVVQIGTGDTKKIYFTRIGAGRDRIVNYKTVDASSGVQLNSELETVTWESDDATVATASETGYVSPVDAGHAMIKATDENGNMECWIVEVNP